MKVLTGVINNNDDGSTLARMAPIMMIFADELADELAEYDELAIRAFMFQIGEVISWIGHGDNERLPEAVKPFAEMIQPSRAGNDQAETPESLDGGGNESEGPAMVAGMDEPSRVPEL